MPSRFPLSVIPVVASLACALPNMNLHAQATAVDAITVAKGFRVELLHSVRGEEQGSWVSLTIDDKGRLITCDQYGGLFRVTPPEVGSTDAPTIEPIDVEVGSAQGLLWAFDSLYVNVNSNDRSKQGLYRVRDTDGDDKLDAVERLQPMEGGGEHGPHAVILSPDKKSLYVCAGNHTEPLEFDRTRLPRNWSEDHLLPRMWDAGGHAVGKVAPGGWIAKTDPDGKEWELIASGFRNEYDIAFNAEGELFTYDADMEWDVGSPWYRPTRVNHVVSGAEFGWRSGTGKWPEYYPDSLGSVVDIGQGSPTGIAFGTGAKFPERYQRALFIADWSYGVIYAVHMTPQGATYTGETERFISAAPLPVTDIVVNPTDGAMYFTIGGRRTQSGLYRVTWQGDDSQVKPPAADTAATMAARELRHKLELLHHPDAEEAIDEAWPHLGSDDRHIRYAARIAIENQPVNDWAGRVLAETDTEAVLTGLLALARQGDESLQTPLLTKVQSVARNFSPRQMLDVTRLLGLSFIRMGRPNDEVAYAVERALNGMYPTPSESMNRELAALLVYLQGPETAAKTIDLLAKAPTQEEQIHYVLVLRELTEGWTPELRKQYFGWFQKAATHRGGNSFTKFLANIRNEALAKLGDADKEALGDLINEPKAVEDSAILPQRDFVKKWSVEELIPIVDNDQAPRDFERGHAAFTEALCFRCHRFAGRGGIVGPDLTGVSGRFNTRNMLESLLEPAKVVSDQYQATIYILEDGRQVTGRVVNLKDDRLMVSENMLNPGKLTNVKRSQIEEAIPARTSMMPEGLLNTFSQDEILDLIAYLKSGGNRQHAIYQR